MTDIARPLDQLHRRLAELLDQPPIDAAAAMRRVESFYLGWEFAEYLDVLDPRAIFTNLLGRPVETICIYPVSSFVPEIIGYFQAAFSRVVLCDNGKQGQVGGIPIRTRAELEPELEEIDAWFLVTRDEGLQDRLAADLPADRVLRIQDLYQLDGFLAYSPGPDKRARVSELITRIHAAPKPLVMINGVYFNNYSPTLKALESQGYDIFVIARAPIIFYAAPDSPLDQIPFAETHRLDMVSILLLLTGLERGLLLFNNTTFLVPGFDAAKALCSMAYPAALMGLARVPSLLFLYDMVVPFTRGLEHEAAYLKVFTSMLAAAAGIVLNSNMPEGLTFMRRALGLR